MKKITQPLTLYLIGATGDLAKKKILKAVYRLFETDLLPDQFTVIGNARKALSQAEFQDYVKTCVEPKELSHWQQFTTHLHYVPGDATQPETFAKLKTFHDDLAAQQRCGNHMWYIATLPQLYLSIVKNIKQHQLQNSACGWTKLLIEKPFGTDLATAQALNHELAEVFAEDQIYRIDHYLGKETVQNLVAFRFANGLFEKLWNRNYIDHIQVTAAETKGVAGRGNFYDATGATRDVLQNHLLQMIAITLMDEPASLNALDIRASRAELLKSISCVSHSSEKIGVAFGQFTAGNLGSESVPAYHETPDVPKNSQTETATAVKLEINSERWRGVPIYVRTGKRLASDVLEISIQFKDPQNVMFSALQYGTDPNVLTFRFQPDESIVLRLFVKKPGHGIELDTVPMEFRYQNKYQMDLIEAYERLIHDATIGDTTLFPSAQSIETSWKLVDQILALKTPELLEKYPAGSWGPQSFDQLIQQDGRSWIDPSIALGRKATA